MQYDVIIVGGSYAGLAAATQLARARRRVLVVDAGQRRNRHADRSHGFLTQDGVEAAAIAATAKMQLLAYPTVDWRDGIVQAIESADDSFVARLDDGQRVQAVYVILATGVADRLPDLPGLAERWGRNVFHCPYCHGYELDQGRVGVFASSPLALHQALLLPDWGTTTLFLNDAFEPDAEQMQALLKRGVTVRRGRVERMVGRCDLLMADGVTEALDGLFVASRVSMATPLARAMGCRVDSGPLGEVLQTDASGATGVRRVFACGDAAAMPHSVTFAVASGARAGMAVHRALIFGD